MKKNGFTVLELIVSFTLAATIGFFLLKITVIIKDLYTLAYIKTNIISKQDIITERMYDDFLYNDVKVVLKCGKNCIRFIFSDNTEKLFKIEDEETFKWGDFTTKLKDGSTFNNISVKILNDLNTTNLKDSILSINIPITNPSIKDEEFITNIVVPYKSRNVHISNLNFEDETYEYYMGLNNPGATYLDVESIFIDPGVYAYYGEDTCTMEKVDSNYYQNLKERIRKGENVTEERKLIGGSSCDNITVKINYGVLEVDRNNEYKVGIKKTASTKENLNGTSGEYDINYTLSINGENKEPISRHITTFRTLNRFKYNGTIANNQSIYEFTVPVSAYYKLETWGASGLGSKTGYGAYATSTVRLRKGEKLYIYVGQTNNSILGTPNFNTNYTTHNFTGYSGGGSTDIRLIKNDLNSRILIAGGGGSGLNETGGYGLEANAVSSYTDSKLTEKSTTTCAPGGGYIKQDEVSCSDKASGGISYIKQKFTINNIEREVVNNNEKYNAKTISGNNTMPNPYTGASSNHGNESDGYAIITFIGNKLE